MAGRNKEEIISTFYNFVIHNRNARFIKLWLDNCASQNKNWALISFFVFIVNSKEIEADTIELNYFEPGHSFMSADNFHHQVEKQVKQKKNVYDFEDFSNCVLHAKEKTKVKITSYSDFYNWPDLQSIANCFLDVYWLSLYVLK